MIKTKRMEKLRKECPVLKVDNKEQFLTDGINEWPLIENEEILIGDMIIYASEYKTITTNRNLLMNISQCIDENYIKYNITE